MKKFLKWLLIVVGILVFIILVTAVIIWLKPLPKFETKKIEVKIDTSASKVENGVKLASMLCRSCHYNESTGKFTGRELKEVKDFGTIYSKNITQDPIAGIGKWTDEQLVFFIRTGIKPDGQYVPPYMPKLAHISDDDLYSIIAFLRSDHPWVQADNTRQPETKPSFLVKFLVFIGAFKPFDYPAQPIPNPDTSNQVERGKYIALYQMECFACHSKDFSKNDYLNPEKSLGFFGGGNEMLTDDGLEIKTLNITMDKETGIGSWTEEQFVKAVKTGIVPTGGPSLRNPMIPYAALSDEEVKAIFAYLKTVPTIQNKVERNFKKDD